jgi:hypothetical protein
MMNIEELQQDMIEITRIFMSAKYCALDFRYLKSSKFEKPLVYSTYCFFIDRMFHATCVSLVLNLSKLFDKREKYSFEKLINKMSQNYSNSEFLEYQSKNDFENMCKIIDQEKIDKTLVKLKTTRDEYYAHLDRSRTSFTSITLNYSEIDELISIADSFIKAIELKYFGSGVFYDLTDGEMGYGLFERLEEWEIYREKYGLINS